ncbi:protein O-mannosyl-transferase TMTC3-like [Diadema antillarum]|uniref:protein O-mannosyl-transferase TMTC3-like n=1 Tax=Diadema antillarum TaxID=105358 RepID=UPI003A848193
MSAISRDLLSSAVLLGVVLLCYSNSLQCGFVFDDRSAVIENRDLLPETSVIDLFYNDFWGTPMHKEKSHKSYRPLCILTFRLNYAVGGLDPWGYHLVNAVLHWLVCILFLKVSKNILDEETSLKASLLFAVHAVHTEAVTGVVGRAELLSSVFMLLSFMSYGVAAHSINKTNWNYMVLTMILAAMATLSKEQGITVVGICCVYEIFYLQKINWLSFTQLHTKTATPKIAKKRSQNTNTLKASLMEAAPRLVFLISATLLLLWARVSIMRAELPTFTQFDNPAASARFPTRHLTFWYLLSVNAWLLLSPCNLLCDWTMGTIPLVTSLGDPRNLATASLVCSVGLLGFYGLCKNGKLSRQLLMALSFLILPFLPASNLFFPVGFVVAERVLYAPSMGFCLLVAMGIERLNKNSTAKWISGVCFGLLLLLHAGRTVRRNEDWKDEYSIFLSALKVTQSNAKAWNNVGHALEKQDKWNEAFQYFNRAATIQPDDIGSWMNIGRAHRQLGRPSEAEAAYRRAMKLMPQPIPGQRYSTKIDPNHLNVYLNLANLLKHNESRLKEAEELYLKAIRMRPDFVDAYINKGEILMKRGKLEEAESLYLQAVKLEPYNANIHYNLGIVAMRKNQKPKALKHFDRAVVLDPKHKMALYNSALYIQESGNEERRPDAIKRLQRVVELDPESELSYSTLGMLAMDDNNNQAAIEYYIKALELNPSSRYALFNLALIYSEEKQPLQAKPYLETLLKYHPNHTKSMLLLGDIYLNVMQDILSSEEMFRRIVELEPSNVQARHNLCVVLVRRGELERAEECLVSVLQFAPNADFAKSNLEILRQKLQAKRAGADEEKHRNDVKPGR